MEHLLKPFYPVMTDLTGTRKGGEGGRGRREGEEGEEGGKGRR